MRSILVIAAAERRFFIEGIAAGERRLMQHVRFHLQYAHGRLEDGDEFAIMIIPSVNKGNKTNSGKEGASE